MNYFDGLDFVNFGDMRNCSLSHYGHYFDGYYGLQFVYGGSFDFSSGKDAPIQIFSAPKLFFTRPRIPYTYGSISGTVRDHAYVCFRGPRAERYIESGLLKIPETDIPVPLSSPETLLQNMRSLFRFLRTPGPGMHERSVLKLEEILLLVSELTSPETLTFPGARFLRDFRKLRDRIAEDPCRDWDFRELARESDLSYVHFRRVFKQTTGYAPKQFLLECRLLHAENLLMHTHLRIGEIASECRFDDAFHFSRFFKKTRGVPPASFRNLYS